MTAACPRSWCRTPARWRATGEARPNRHGRLRADLVCECGYQFSSALPDAIAACNVVRVANGLEAVVSVAPTAPPMQPIPQPSLPIAKVPSTQGFVSFGHMANAMVRDFKARQAGEREPGEDG